MSAAPNPFHARDPFQPLLDRGITRQAIAHFAWMATTTYCHEQQRMRPSWRFPIVDEHGAIVGHKVKYSDGQKPKERWAGPKSLNASAVVYNLQGIAARPTALLVEGPADALLCASLGLPAASFLCGVAAPKPETVAILKRATPGRYIVVYDQDAAGRAGAITTIKVLRGAGLLAHALALPDTLPEHGDVTDLYAASGYDRAAFIDALRGCAPLAIPLDPPRRSQPRQDAPDRGAFNQANPLVALVEGYGVTLKRSGSDYVALCPFHEERTPSFKINPAKGAWYCHGACQTGGDAYWFDRLMQRTTGVKRFVSSSPYIYRELETNRRAAI